MNQPARPVLWTIAGFDPSGGAGVLADVASMRVFGLDAVAAVTAVTAQRPGRVAAVDPVRPALLREQLEALAERWTPEYVKTGMIPTPDLVDVVADWLPEGAVLVVDPVWKASTGATLATDEALARLRERLLPRATAVTPNLAEAGALLGRDGPVDLAEAAEAGRALAALVRRDGFAVVTGGHLEGDPVDTVAWRDRWQPVASRRVPGESHGTGCRFASALLGGLARGRDPVEAVRWAQQVVVRYLSGGQFPT